jgi:murein DD-endopeptidase MepM/ murein hydrolase activator NlpD
MNIDGRLSLDQIHQSPAPDTKSALKSATEEFEGMFIGYLLKVMRSTLDSDEGGELTLGKDLYMDLFDNEIALSIARNRSLGIGEMMYRQLQEAGHEKAPAKTERSEPTPPANDSVIEREVVSLTLPVQGRLTSEFGARLNPLTGRPQFHKGIDIAAPAGTPFRAAASGTVVFAGVLNGYGNTVVVEHAGGERTIYGHASVILVKDGDAVQSEQPLGFVGSTGQSTGPHLHFETLMGGQQLDPKALLAMRESGKVHHENSR